MGLIRQESERPCPTRSVCCDNCAGFAIRDWRRCTLLRRLSFSLVPHVSLHFEARQEFDIARSAIDAGFFVALEFGAGTKLNPFCLKVVACLYLIGNTPLLHLLRAAFELALPRDFE